MDILLALCVLAPAATTEPEPAVCITGYIMDSFCIDRGTLLDDPSVTTLENPERHSLHCLVDVGRCRSSGYEVLVDKGAGASPRYTNAYKLDEAGNELVLAAAREEGDPSAGCTTCSAGGSLQRGYRATIVGQANGCGLAVSEVLSSSVSCASLNMSDLAAANVNGSDCGGRSGSLYVVTILHASLMLVAWGLLIPVGVIVARCMRHRDPLWYRVHRACQSLGLVLALIGFLLAVTHFDVFQPGYTTANVAHGATGVLIMCLGLVQPLALLRPHKPSAGEQPSTARRVWQLTHKGGGYLAVVLALPTIGVGTTFVRPEHSLYFQVAYAAVLLALLLLAVHLCRASRRAAPPDAAKADTGKTVRIDLESTSTAQHA